MSHYRYLIINKENLSVSTETGQCLFPSRAEAEAYAKEMPGCRVIDADFWRGEDDDPEGEPQ